MLNIFREIFVLAIGLLLFSNCVTHRKMLLLQESKGSVKDTLQSKLRTQYLLQSGDVVDIKVSSLDPSSVAIFNKSVGVATSAVYNEASLYVNGYMVDQFGSINLPLIGDLPVYGISIDSLNNVLDVRLRDYFKYYTVEAKLVNYRVSVLGEVRQAGTQLVYNNNVNVLQVLSNAGGVTDHGNRRKVKVIRKAFGDHEVAVIDVSSDDVINNEYFYLMPNDVVYIEPYKSKAVSLNVPLFALLISATSLAILVINTVGN